MGELFSRYWRAARAAAFGVTGELASAEDAAAEAFKQALGGLRSLRDPDRFGPWLRTIVVRKARQGRRGSHSTVDDLADELHDRNERPDDALERHQLSVVIQQAMRELPQQLRETMALFYFEGYDSDAAARFLDIPAGTLRRRLHDGRTHLRTLEKEFDSLITLLIDSGSFTDRVDTTGVLSNQAARDLGIVGMAARASGIDADLRRDHPHDAYETLRFEVPVESGGDVRARLMVRAREVEQSFLIVQGALDMLPDTPLRSVMPDALPADSAALGWAEAWRGPCVHWVATDERGRLTRVKITDPSFLNWPGLAHAVPGNIIPDFPVINKSFNLSYSGNDR